ncbi:MAG: TolC family protein [Candidatus Aminicenantales bacterium]
MFKRSCLGSVLILIFITALFPAPQGEKKLNLSLDDCIIKALKNNLDVAINVLDPQLSELAVSVAREKFLPQLSFQFNSSKNNFASYSWIDAAENVETKNSNYSLQFSQLLPTGGTISGSLYNYSNDTNMSFQTINPRYGSTLRFNFTQPLLRNFGSKMNRREIIIAFNNSEISDNNLKQALQNTIYDVEEAYWNLVYNIELLKVRRQSLKLARDLLEKNKKSVEVGTMAPMEILTAESTVATREADILQQEANVKNAEDLLKSLLNLPQAEAEITTIIPSDKPTYEEVKVNLDEALMTAIENRPDLESTRLEIKNREINLSYAKNQLLPNLSLQASYWSPGISGTQLIYLNNNPLTGEVVDTIPGSIKDALKDAFNFKYKNWSINLALDIPLDTIFSRAQYAQAKLNLEQALLRMKNQEQNIYLEIKTAVRAVETNYKRVQAYKIARELQEKKLEAEEEKLRVGLTTNYFVLQYQRDLADAQVAELKAIIDYSLSIARLNRAMGITLNKKNIRLPEFFGN